MEKNAAKIIHWSLLFLLAVYVITGLGIAHYQTVGFLTFGLLSKALAFRLHADLLYPFLALLALHLYCSLRRKK